MTKCSGRQLLTAFERLGGYHVIFWNCQVFTKLFLELICQEKINFGMLTALDMTCLVIDIVKFSELIPKTLCAFVIPSPIATSKWRNEHQKSRTLISEMIKKVNNSSGDELLVVSDEAIKYIVLETISEPENVAQIEKLQEPKASMITFVSVFLIIRVFWPDSTCFWDQIKWFYNARYMYGWRVEEQICCAW